MSIYTQFKTDPKAEVGGVPIKFKPNKDGTVPTVYLARMGGANKDFSRIHTEAWKPFQGEITAGAMSDAQRLEIAVGVFVDSCVRGWSNMQDENDVAIPFSREAAIKLFNDLPELYSELAVKAAELDTFLSANLAIAAKN